jgi:hypothetical protein
LKESWGIAWKLNSSEKVRWQAQKAELSAFVWRKNGKSGLLSKPGEDGKSGLLSTGPFQSLSRRMGLFAAGCCMLLFPCIPIYFNFVFKSI